jgi:hypothetical protein
MNPLLLKGSAMNPDEVFAYRQGERASDTGSGFFAMPYSYAPHGDNALLWAWLDGFFEAERRASARVLAREEAA